VAYKVYIAKDQETVYDIAIKLYKDARGVSDILTLNASLDLDSDTYYGQEIVYDDSVKYTKEIFTTDFPATARDKWKTRDNQNLFDLAIQIYGDISGLEKILPQVDVITDPGAGTDNVLANVLFSQKIVATSPLAGGVTPSGGIGVMIIEDTFIVG